MKFFATIALSLLCFSASAQFGAYRYYSPVPYSHLGTKGKLWRQRTFFGICLPQMTMDMQQTYTRSQGGGLPAVDTSIHTQISSSSSFGIISGSFFKLVRSKKEECLALEVALGMYYYNWSMPPITYSPVDKGTGNAFMLQMDMPLSLQYKTGGEANCNRKHRVLFSCGAGVDPMLSGTGYLTGSSIIGKIRTFGMAELGVFAGIAWKFRVMYYPSTVLYLNSTGTDLPGTTSNDGNLTLVGNGSSNVVFVFILMPDSWHWSRDDDY